jgi:hypothetical protein
VSVLYLGVLSLMNIQALRYSSIQEMLMAHEYVIDQGHNWFVRSIGDARMIVIPFTALVGHSVETFYEKAEQCGWLKPVQSTVPAPEPPPLYQFTPDQIF